MAFNLPGIEGKLDGAFALHTKVVDLRGEIYTNGQLADTTCC
jgi:hypothetical protein